MADGGLRQTQVATAVARLSERVAWPMIPVSVSTRTMVVGHRLRAMSDWSHCPVGRGQQVESKASEQTLADPRGVAGSSALVGHRRQIRPRCRPVRWL